jgi:hypothetical protein
MFLKPFDGFFTLENTLKSVNTAFFVRPRRIIAKKVSHVEKRVNNENLGLSENELSQNRNFIPETFFFSTLTRSQK